MEKPWWLWIIDLFHSLFSKCYRSTATKQKASGKNVQQISLTTEKGDIHLSIEKLIDESNQNPEKIRDYLTVDQKSDLPKNTGEIVKEEFARTIEQAQLLLKSGNFKDSTCMFEKASYMGPSEPMPHFYLGFLYLTIGMPDASIIHSEKSIVFGGDNFASWMNLGIAFIHNRQPERAIYAFDRAEQLKEQANIVEIGKLYLFRAEARYSLSLQQNRPEQIIPAQKDVEEGEKLLIQQKDNPVAKFWLESVLQRKEAIRGIKIT